MRTLNTHPLSFGALYGIPIIGVVKLAHTFHCQTSMRCLLRRCNQFAQEGITFINAQDGNTFPVCTFLKVNKMVRDCLRTFRQPECFDQFAAPNAKLMVSRIRCCRWGFFQLQMRVVQYCRIESIGRWFITIRSICQMENTFIRLEKSSLPFDCCMSLARLRKISLL